MKKIITLFIALFCASSTYAQVVPSEDSTYSAIAYWSKADTMIYDVEFKKYKVDKGDTTVQFFTTYSIEISVLDSTESSYVIRAKYVVDSVYNKDYTMNELTMLMNNISIDIETSEMGIIDGVKNWKDVSNQKNKALDKFEKNYQNKFKDFEKVIKGLKFHFSTKENVDKNAIGDLQQMFYFHGLDFKLREPLGIEDTVLNKFGNGTLKIKGEVNLDTIYVDEGVAKLYMYQEVDPDDLKKELIMLLKINHEPITDLVDSIETVDTTINTTYIDTYTGWIINSYEDKASSIGGLLTIQERSIRLR